MIEYIILFILLAMLTAGGYFIGMDSIKETTYEEAKGTQRIKGKTEKKEIKVSKKIVNKIGRKQKEPEKVSLASNIVKEALSNYKKPQPLKSEETNETSSFKKQLPTKTLETYSVFQNNKIPLRVEKIKSDPVNKRSDINVQNNIDILDGTSNKKKQLDIKPKMIKKTNKSNEEEKLKENNIIVDSKSKQNKFEEKTQKQKRVNAEEKIQKQSNTDEEEIIQKQTKTEKGSISEKYVPIPEKQSTKVNTHKEIKSGTVSNKLKKDQVLEVSSGEAEQIMIVAKQMQETQHIAKSKKKLKEKPVVVKSVETNSLNSILPLIEGAQLNSAEIQIMIDLLLNRQNECNTKGGEWVEMGRVNPITLLRKQLDDAERCLKEENESKLALSDKIISLRGELKNEKINLTNVKKQLEQTSSFMHQKLQEAAQVSNDQLNLKIKELTASLERNFQAQMMQQKQTLQVEYEGQLQHLNAIHDDTEKKLQQYCHSQAECELQLQKSRSTIGEYEQRIQPLEAAYTEAEKQCQVAVQGRDEMAQTVQKYQQHMSTLKDQSGQKEATLTRQVHELQSSLKASENARTQALTQYSQVTGEREQLIQQIANLENIREHFSQNQTKLQSTIQEKMELECRLNKVDNELSKIREVAKNQMIKIEELQKEKEELASQAFRPAADGQENGDSHEKKENIVNNNLNAIYEENISSLSNEVSKLKEKLDNQQFKCKELRSKNSILIVALHDAEAKLLRCLKKSDLVNSYEEEWNYMREILGKIFPAILHVAVDDKPALVKKVEEETKKVIEKKPEIVEKVIKIAEEDGEKYKQLKEENAALVKKISQIEAENGSLGEKIAEILSKPKPIDNSSKLTELTEENKNLNEKVANYMNVLANTESLLESLQVSVEKEEKSWKEKMVEKDSEVTQLAAEKNTLLVKIDELKATAITNDSSEISCLKARLQKEQEQNQKLSSQLETQSQNSTNPEVNNANGSQNGIESHERKLSLEDATSLLSNSSISEGLGSTAESSSSNGNKKKKKKKSFLAKLIG